MELRGSDGFLYINVFQMARIVPQDEYKVEFNKAVEHTVDIGFPTPLTAQFPTQGGAAAMNQVTPTGTYKPDYDFAIFKDPTQDNNNSSLANGCINCDADIDNLQTNIGSLLYRTLPEVA